MFGGIHLQLDLSREGITLNPFIMKGEFFMPDCIVPKIDLLFTLFMNALDHYYNFSLYHYSSLLQRESIMCG